VPETLAIPDAEIVFEPAFLRPDTATSLLQTLQNEILWQQDEITLFGSTHLIPRMHQWFGDPNIDYKWSGITMSAQNWHPELAKIRGKAERFLGTRFNGVLANLYRDGNDSMGWHADDEVELGDKPIIASISLGAEREFKLRSKNNRTQRRTETIKLTHGSLLLMAGDTQGNWQHSLPKRKRVTEPRINLTFRYLTSAKSSDLKNA